MTGSYLSVLVALRRFRRRAHGEMRTERRSPMTVRGKDLMRRAAVVVTANTALAAGALLAGSGPAMASTGAPKTDIPLPSVSAAAAVSATADPATGGVTIDSVTPGATAALGAPAAGSGYSCYVRTRRRKKVVAYRPLTLFKEGRSYEYHWLVAPYSVKHARIVAGQYTFQAQLCVTGRGHTWNSWHQWFDGGAILMMYRRSLEPTLPSYGHAVTGGSATASLNFKVNLGIVSIGGSTQIYNYGTHTGDEGSNCQDLWIR